MSKHLRLDLIGKYEEGDDRHAIDVMKDLGISYQYAVPQSLGDCWDFWNCDNVQKLPSYISEFECEDPMRHVGFGLSEKMAKALNPDTKE